MDIWPKLASRQMFKKQWEGPEWSEAERSPLGVSSLPPGITGISGYRPTASCGTWYGPRWVAELVAGGTRGDAGESVPGHALFLNHVSY